MVFEIGTDWITAASENSASNSEYISVDNWATPCRFVVPMSEGRPMEFCDR